MANVRLIAESEPSPQRAKSSGIVAASMATFRELIPWAAYSLSAWDVGSGSASHVVLAGEGYPPAVEDHLNGAFIEGDPTFHLLRTQVTGAPRWRDLEREWNTPFADSRTAQEVLIPAGFREGVTMCLRTPDSRYTGSLHVSWSSSTDADDGVRQTIERFSPLLATICDRLSGAQATLDRHGPGVHAVLLHNDGRNTQITDFPGRPSGPLMTDEALRDTLLRHHTLLHRRRYLWADAIGSCHRIELTRCSPDVVAISEHEIAWPFGITKREAGILHLVAEGWSNRVIAEHLTVSPRTVSTHVEHLLHKLRCDSRAGLAATAVRHDLSMLDRTVPRA